VNEAKKILVAVVFVFSYSFSIALPLLLLARYGVPSEVDVEVLNGIIVISAIFMLFSDTSIWKKTSAKEYSVLALILGTQLLLMLMAGLTYFLDYITYHHITSAPFIFASMSMFFNTFSWLLVRILMVYWRKE
jgi:hypothetical protein